MIEIFDAGNQQQGRLVRLRIYMLCLALILAGPLFSHLPESELFWQEFGQRYGAFLMVLLIWELVIRFISRFILQSAGKRPLWKKIALYSLPLILSIIAFYWAGHLEAKVSEEFFLGVVFILGVRGLAEGLKLSGFFKYSFYLLLAYFMGIAVFSGALATLNWHWQFAVIASSLSMGLVAQFLLGMLKQNADSKDFRAPLYLRAHTLSLFLGPLVILMMIYNSYLGSSYLLTFLSLAPVTRVAERARALENPKVGSVLQMADLLQVEIYSCFASVLFVALLVLSKFVQF